MRHSLRQSTFFLFVVVSFSLLTGCHSNVGKPEGTPVKMEYSRLLDIVDCGSYRLVTINDPWKTDRVLHRYALVERNSSKQESISSPSQKDGSHEEVSDKLPDGIPPEVTVVKVPLERICVSTSVHTALMQKLGALGRVASICESKYMLNPAVQAEIKKGRIKDVGSGLNPSVEMIAQLRTDALLMSPFEGASYGLLEKTGIPIIECADYMETSALGRAEWMKFYGMLVGREAEANALFEEVRDNYNSLKALVAKEKKHPKLLADLLSGNTWYMPGGGSCYGALYKDAGADYSIASDKASGSQPLSLESVLLGGRDADVWIIKYSRPENFTYASLLQENTIYSEFVPFREHHIYGCNALLTPFYEEVPFRPDILLKDIISILYPNLLPDYKAVYYSPLPV